MIIRLVCMDRTVWLKHSARQATPISIFRPMRGAMEKSASMPICTSIKMGRLFQVYIAIE